MKQRLLTADRLEGITGHSMLETDWFVKMLAHFARITLHSWILVSFATRKCEAATAELQLSSTANPHSWCSLSHCSNHTNKQLYKLITEREESLKEEYGQIYTWIVRLIFGLFTMSMEVRGTLLAFPPPCITKYYTFLLCKVTNKTIPPSLPPPWGGRVTSSCPLWVTANFPWHSAAAPTTTSPLAFLSTTIFWLSLTNFIIMELE